MKARSQFQQNFQIAFLPSTRGSGHVLWLILAVGWQSPSMGEKGEGPAFSGIIRPASLPWSTHLRLDSVSRGRRIWCHCCVTLEMVSAPSDSQYKVKPRTECNSHCHRTQGRIYTPQGQIFLLHMLTNISERNTWCHCMSGSIFSGLWPQKIKVQLIYWIQT